MQTRFWTIAAALLAVAGCTDTGGSGSGQYIRELPEEVRAIIAPNQDISEVRIDPEDGCFVYRYVGPVETTFLPLRSRDGRPICTQRPEEEAPKKT